MSYEFGITEKLNLKNLWTQPSKEQFLLPYVKSIYDEYRSMPPGRQCVLVLEHGSQPHSNPPTWVYMSDSGKWQRPKPFIIQLQEENRVQLIREEEAGYTILNTKLPILARSNNIDESKSALCQVLEFAPANFKENYGGFLLALGSVPNKLFQPCVEIFSLEEKTEEKIDGNAKPYNLKK
eukprot:gene1568-1729_t